MPNYKKADTAPLEKETIVVEFAAKGRFGPYVKANGEFYGLNEPLTENDFQKGQAYMVLVKRSGPSDKNPKGKGYISQIVGGTGANGAAGTMEAAAKAHIAPNEAQAAAKEAVAATTAAKKAYDDKESTKNTRILWQGVLQALIQSPIYATQGLSGKDFISAVKADAEEFVAFFLEKAGA